MLAGSEDTILLFVGAPGAFGGLLADFVLTRPKRAVEQLKNTEPKVASPVTETTAASTCPAQPSPRNDQPAERVSISEQTSTLPVN